MKEVDEQASDKALDDAHAKKTQKEIYTEFYGSNLKAFKELGYESGSRS